MISLAPLLSSDADAVQEHEAPALPIPSSSQPRLEGGLLQLISMLDDDFDEGEEDEQAEEGSEDGWEDDDDDDDDEVEA